MATPKFNDQRTTDHTSAVSVLHTQVQQQITAAASTNYDQSAQLQFQLAKGIVSPQDVRVFKGV
jgi:hypothetical protein